MGTNRWEKYKIQKFTPTRISQDINKPFETVNKYLTSLNNQKQTLV